MEKEILRRRPPILTLESFCRDLVAYVRAGEADGRATRLALVTYNRVGEGLLGSHESMNGLDLDLYQGRTNLPSLTSEESARLMLGGEADDYRPNLTLEEVKSFFGDVKLSLIRRIMANDRSSEVVMVYGGEGDKFSMALKLIEEVSSLARGLGKESQMKFFLLTCNCGLAKKVTESGQAYKSGQLECLVYNPSGECGGFADLQNIAETVLG